MSGTDPGLALILDLLEWLKGGPRPYAEVLDAWRTSCPRLSIWEDALAGGFIRVERLPGASPPRNIVVLTDCGRDALTLAGRASAPQPIGSAETPRSFGIHADPAVSGADAEDWLKPNWRPH